MDFMNQSVFFEALGWSLIDSLWQVGAIWLFYVLITRNGSRFSADKRHTLAMLGIISSTLLFFISILVNCYSVVSSGRIYSLAYFVQKEASGLFSPYGNVYEFVPLLSYVYLPVVIFFTCRLFFQFTLHKKNYRKTLLPADHSISHFASEMCERFGVSKKVALWISDKAESPLTLGFWKPVILLPVAVFSQLTCKQVEAVIAHEIYHVKRNDFLLNIFLTLSEVVLFFNPFARLLAGIVKKERENSCDDHVIASGFDAWEYSQALYILGRYRHHNDLAVAATGLGKEYLLHRIRRIMKKRNPQPSFLKPAFTFFLCLVVAGFASRHKQVPVLADVNTATETSPVVYFEKQVTISEPVIIEQEKKILSPESKPGHVRKPVVPPEAPPPPELMTPEDAAPDDTEEILHTYVTAPLVLEFTMIDPENPDVPDIVCESPQPYVQKSSFYYTEIDSTAGKNTIKL
jgi:beta-lactamase regulating signal transducer with metallopeptidase domain